MAKTKIDQFTYIEEVDRRGGLMLTRTFNHMPDVAIYLDPEACVRVVEFIEGIIKE